MTDATLLTLLATAATLGFVHTLTGPDHYIPFIAMSRVGRWSFPKTMVITTLCGVGHVLSSVLLGALGVAFGWAVTSLEGFEGLRGDLAGWLLLGFGMAYMVWGIRQAIRNRPHAHLHVHDDGTAHAHEHQHHGAHLHVHAPPQAVGAADHHHHPGEKSEGAAGAMTPWILFTIFAFGPCEPLIPLLMYPAAKLSLSATAVVATVFSVITIGTMLTVVAIGYFGLLKLPVTAMARYSHALAGFAIFACGTMMKLGF